MDSLDGATTTDILFQHRHRHMRHGTKETGIVHIFQHHPGANQPCPIEGKQELQYIIKQEAEGVKNIVEGERCVCGGRCVPVQKMIQRADKPRRWSHSSLLDDTPRSVNILERCQPVQTRWGGSLGALALVRMVTASGPWKPGWGFEIMVQIPWVL